MPTSSRESSRARSPARVALRPLSRADRQAVAKILEECGAFSPEEVGVALGLVDAGFAGDPDYELLAAVCSDEVAGYACYGPSPFTQSSYDLYWIAVDPAVQGAGVGRALLAGVESRVAAAGGKLLLADTAAKPSYARTRAFYEAAGYAAEARIRDYYAPGDDRITYAKRF
jgi:ribosomal protein S18 acetylase RimI-like enzyme